MLPLVSHLLGGKAPLRAHPGMINERAVPMIVRMNITTENPILSFGNS